MKFLIDAQLPRRMVNWFAAVGQEAIHTLDLSEGNRTPDRTVAERADADKRIDVSKDSDFVDSHLLLGSPSKLLLISTGNLSNRDLELLLSPRINQIAAEFLHNHFLELGNDGLDIRG